MPHYVLRVEVVNGPSKGQVVVVQDRSTLIVGRLTECGLSFPQDYTVSRQHFQIELHASKGRLIHLSKTGPTLVNGVSVTEVELNSGDVLEFGAGNKVRIILEDAREVIGPTAAVPVRTEPTRSKSPNGFTASMASCGWSFYESTDDQLGFEKLLKILADSRPFSVLLDFRRIDSCRFL